MDLAPFARGLLVGITLAAPVGPMSLLCIRRTLVHGRAIGLLSGLGIATGDALYGAVAALGLTAVAAFLVDGGPWLGLLGGIALCVVGIRIARAPTAVLTARARRAGAAGAYLSMVGLTLTNPATVLTFAALIAGLGAGTDRGGRASAFALVLGVFAGSAAWWAALVVSVSALRTRLTQGVAGRINLASGLVIAGFGVAAVIGAIR